MTDLGVIVLTDHEIAVTRAFLDCDWDAKATAAAFAISDRRVRQIVAAVERKSGLSRASLTILLLGAERPRRTSIAVDRQLALTW